MYYDTIHNPLNNKIYRLKDKDGINTLNNFINYNLKGGSVSEEQLTEEGAINILKGIDTNTDRREAILLYEKYEKIMEIVEYKNIIILIKKKIANYELIINKLSRNDRMSITGLLAGTLGVGADTSQSVDTKSVISDYEEKKKDLNEYLSLYIQKCEKSEKEYSDLKTGSKTNFLKSSEEESSSEFTSKLADYENGFQDYFYNGSININFNLKTDTLCKDILKEFNTEDKLYIPPLEIFSNTNLLEKIPILKYLMVKDDNSKPVLHNSEEKTGFQTRENQNAFVSLHNGGPVENISFSRINYIPIGLILNWGIGLNKKYISRICYGNRWWNINDREIPMISEISPMSTNFFNDARIYAVFYIKEEFYKNIDKLTFPYKPRYIVNNENISYFTSLLQNLFYIDYLCRSYYIDITQEKSLWTWAAKGIESTLFGSTKGKIDKYIDIIYTNPKLYELNDTNLYKNKKYQIINDTDMTELIKYVIEKYKGLYSDLKDSQGNLPKTDYIVMKKIIENNDKIIFFGDLHSSVHALIDKLLYMQSQGVFNENWILRKDIYFICCGDMVDRGPYGIEIIYILFSLFLINDKNRFIILNGNHEEENIYNLYGFKEEMDNHYGENSPLTSSIKECINYLPVAVFLKYKNQDKYIQFCHGGIDKSQLVNKKEDTIKLEGNFEESIISRFLKNEEEFLFLDTNTNESRAGIEWGFMWSDFKQIGRSNLDELRPKFNSSDTRKILDHNNIYSVLSGHQDFFELSFTSDKEDNNNFQPYNKFLQFLKYDKSEVKSYNDLFTLKSLITSSTKSIDVNSYENETLQLKDICGLMISSSAIPRYVRKSIWCTIHNPLSAPAAAKEAEAEVEAGAEAPDGYLSPVITVNWIDTCNTSDSKVSLSIYRDENHENNEQRCQITDINKLKLNQ